MGRRFACLLLLASAALASSVGKPVPTIRIGTAAAAIAAPPSANSAGSFWVLTNGAYTHLATVSSSWRYFIGGVEAFPPSLGSFTVDNVASTTTSTTTGALTLSNPSSTLALTAYYAPVPGAAFTVTAHIKMNQAGSGNGYCWLGLRDNAGKITVFLHDPQSGGFYTSRWTNTTTFSAAGSITNVSAPLVSGPGSGSWLRISESGGTRTFSTSGDGVNFNAVGTEASGTFNAADNYAFGINQTGIAPRSCDISSLVAQ